jgi:hypothetical protein
MTARKMALVPRERIVRAIHVFREERVMLDTTLAELYGVETRTLIQAVKRNLVRFPSDFMFQLTRQESDHLRSQTVMSSSHGGRRSRPYAFTEQGVAMLSSVLHSQRAVEVNLEIMRTFVQLRQMFAGHAGSRQAARRARAALRPAVSDRFRRHSRPHHGGGNAKEAYRFSNEPVCAE